MGIKFNGGYGGVTCECCQKLIAAGRDPNWKYIYETQSNEHIVLKSRSGNNLHYCSAACRDKHNANARREHD